MSLQNHIVELERRHKDLDREIAAEGRHAATSDEKLAELKRKKLHLKEEIEKFRAEHKPPTVN